MEIKTKQIIELIVKTLLKTLPTEEVLLFKEEFDKIIRG